MYSRRFRLSLKETKAYFDCVNCSCRNKMSYQLARWTHDDVRVTRSGDFLQFPIFGPELCCQHFLCFIFHNRSIQMTVVHVSKACGRRRSGTQPAQHGGFVAPAPISSRFLDPRPHLLLGAPNQNRQAAQAKRHPFSFDCLLHMQEGQMG